MKSKRVSLVKRRELSNEYLSSFCMELSMLLQAGIAPYDSIMMLCDDEPDDDEKTVLVSLTANLEKGASLSASLRESGYFPQYMITMTEAGEKTGRFTESLRALSEHYDRQERLMASIRDAVFYPLLLFALMTAVIIVIIVWVLPVFSSVLNRFGTQLPPFAVSLMRFGGWLADFFMVIAAVFVAVIICAAVMWAMPSVRARIKKAFINMFGGTGIFWKITVSRIVSVMALATASGIDPENAMELAFAASEGSVAAEKGRASFLEALRSGSSFSEAMRRAGFLSSRNTRMLSAGSRGGMADTAMTEIAARCERDTNAEIDGLVKIIEPALVIASSVIVGAILLMVMVPLMSIMTAIG